MNALHSYNLNAFQAVVLFLTVALFCAGATAPTVPPAARSELAPTGKLRVGLLVMNPVYVSKDGSIEEMRGIAVDIARELAKQLGVAFEPVKYKGANQLLEGAKTGEWDEHSRGLNAFPSQMPGDN